MTTRTVRYVCERCHASSPTYPADQAPKPARACIWGGCNGTAYRVTDLSETETPDGGIALSPSDVET